MPGTSTPKNLATDDGKDAHPSSRDARRPSVIGLFLVSGLNIACLAFIAFHFANHPSEPTARNIKQTDAQEKNASNSETHLAGPTSDTGRTGSRALGNVELAPAPRYVISIAAGFRLTDMEPIERQVHFSAAPAEPVSSSATKISAANEHHDHWVQLGALSKEAAARSYWSRLKLRHKSLLQDREPRYFGPTEVGGSLFHVRLGPMSGDAAASLCERLEAVGADCFCVRSDDGHF